MAPRSALLVLVCSSWVARVASQQGVLVDGNSKLPACAQSCPKLVQAAQACSATTSASQSAWVCFCQSAYLTTLSQSDAGMCDDVCTSSADSQQVSAWYRSNCGTDHGESEHADSDSAATTTAAAPVGSGPTFTASAAPSLVSNSADGSSQDSSDSQTSSGGSWWDTHYKWIIMLLVLVVTLPLLAFILIWLRRRHERRQDQIHGGFNAGITTRSPPSGDTRKDAMGLTVASSDASGRNSPARTRDAFMPYGYGYSRSESRLAAGQVAHEERGSPLAREEMRADDTEPEKSTTKQISKRLLVRKGGEADAIEGGKGDR